MKIVFLIASLLCFIPYSAKAQFDQNNVAEKLYEECLAAPDPSLDRLMQIEECACISAHQSQYQGTPGGKEWYSAVYAPCLYVGAQSLTYDQCHENKYNAKAVYGDEDKLESICNCMASWAESFFRDNAQGRLENILQHFELDYIETFNHGPLDVIMHGREYRTLSQEAQARCRAKYAP